MGEGDSSSASWRTRNDKSDIKVEKEEEAGHHSGSPLPPFHDQLKCHSEWSTDLSVRNE
jgi:hypothetical protein